MAKLQNRPLESPRIIVCEGADEADILILLRNEIKKTEADVEIVNAEGRQHLVAFCGDQLKSSGGSDIRLMAVVLDNEDDLAQTQTLMANIRTEVGKRSELKFYCLPSNDQTGALETLIRDAIPAHSPGHACATQWAQCVESDTGIPPSHQKTTQAQRDKAWLQVWLTHRTRDTAYSRIGYALAKNADLRDELNTALNPLRQVLRDVLSANLDSP
ncbi:MAG: hypothetical protein Q8K34_01325 [Hydrogenophaga sp.]|uniref:DUF3226 domain-containing protein n=1 Tax=Hydrogenophaga sp. TaxID=1904254 RepID=UPI0027264BD2|nr:DUF3226 domain-containing protein [Hydrogenophaga sp.]MDO9482141.1 hypothetical protein [Hydrogenophaga sp.]MDP2218829.1 hypothetical protein [Hydrogenophaga sp.]MDP3346416.1 hypothetical protein [Hydrogenophaga sp.]MDP3806229.1 hypothetical protein [Hydrogenophaga sp.]MDP3926860.1 hypothetical protein [Hydrogenophaga sp.]